MEGLSFGDQEAEKPAQAFKDKTTAEPQDPAPSLDSLSDSDQDDEMTAANYRRYKNRSKRFLDQRAELAFTKINRGVAIAEDAVLLTVEKVADRATSSDTNLLDLTPRQIMREGVSGVSKRIQGHVTDAELLLHHVVNPATDAAPPKRKLMDSTPRDVVEIGIQRTADKIRQQVGKAETRVQVRVGPEVELAAKAALATKKDTPVRELLDTRVAQVFSSLVAGVSMVEKLVRKTLNPSPVERRRRLNTLRQPKGKSKSAAGSRRRARTRARRKFDNVLSRAFAYKMRRVHLVMGRFTDYGR